MIDNAIHHNAISQNAIGIDLGGDGVTANDNGDADPGANDLQNFPVLSDAITSGTQVKIEGTLNSAANHTFTVEFFASSGPDSNGNVEGERFLGSATVSIDNTGNATFSSSLSANVSDTATSICVPALRLLTLACSITLSEASRAGTRSS